MKSFIVRGLHDFVTQELFILQTAALYQTRLLRNV